MLATDAPSLSTKTTSVLLLLSITAAQERLMGDGNQAQASPQAHIEETLSDPMYHRTDLLALGLYPHYEIEKCLKNVFIRSLFFYLILLSHSILRLHLRLENPTNIRQANCSGSHHASKISSPI